MRSNWRACNLRSIDLPPTPDHGAQPTGDRNESAGTTTTTKGQSSVITDYQLESTRLCTCSKGDVVRYVSVQLVPHGDSLLTTTMQLDWCEDCSAARAIRCLATHVTMADSSDVRTTTYTLHPTDG